MATEHEYPLNMHNWGHSRKRRKPGDVFTYLMPDGKYRFLRLISTTAQSGMGGPANLLYFYSLALSNTQVPQQDAFIPPQLLIPPQLTNNLGWVRGWFKFVAHWPLQSGEVFRDRYLDEHGERLASPFQPLGSWALTGYSKLDLDLSRALGIPHAFDLAMENEEERGS